MKHVPVIALVILVLGTIALVLMPFYLVSPERSQTQADIALSYELKIWNGPLTLVNLVVGAVLALMIWNRSAVRRLHHRRRDPSWIRLGVGPGSITSPEGEGSEQRRIHVA